MKKSERDSLIKEVTDAALTTKFTSEVGQKARVERTEISNPHMDQLRDVLREIGRNLSEVGAAPKGMQYVGSLSVHVYKAETMKMAAFATLNAGEKMTFDLADGALRELTGATRVAYGKNRQKLRSGF